MDNGANVPHGTILSTELETLKSEAQIQAEKDHKARLEAMANVTSRVKLPKDLPLEEIPEVKGLIERLKSEWNQKLQDDNKPVITFGTIAPTKGHNNASIITIYHDHEINIKPISLHDFEIAEESDGSSPQHTCFQGCDTVPDYIQALENALNFLKAIQ